MTTSDFNYKPSSKTKPEIWKYLNAANLIKFDEVDDKERLKELEIAANNNKLNKKTIFEFYRQIPFNLNNLFIISISLVCIARSRINSHHSFFTTR